MLECSKNSSVSPSKDFRIDFEDGYGNRPDAEEDQHAKIAAERWRVE